ncbi:MAG TPA: hypothetical protein VF748_14565 [Candidatus Acidoferrum sp.]
MPGKSSVQKVDDPYSFFGVPVTTVGANGAPATYGQAAPPGASAKPIDAVYCSVTGNLVVQDQNYDPSLPYAGQLKTFTAVPAGVTIPISPSIIDSTTTGTYVLLYK